MAKTTTLLALTLYLAVMAVSAPLEDQVHFPVANYTNHNWYSGKTALTKAI